MRFIRATPAGNAMKVRTTGQQAREEDDDLAALLEPAVGEVELVLRDEQVAPVALDRRAAALGADPVGDLAPEVAAEGAGDGGEDEVEGRERRRRTAPEAPPRPRGATSPPRTA